MVQIFWSKITRSDLITWMYYSKCRTGVCCERQRKILEPWSLYWHKKMKFKTQAFKIDSLEFYSKQQLNWLHHYPFLFITNLRLGVATIIIPIFKKGNKFITLPVSLKLVVCKFFEFIIQEKMLDHFIFCQIIIWCLMNLFLKSIAWLSYCMNLMFGQSLWTEEILWMFCTLTLWRPLTLCLNAGLLKIMHMLKECAYIQSWIGYKSFFKDVKSKPFIV